MSIKRIISILPLIALFCVSAGVSAQELPTLKDDPSITTGTLASGVRYYFARSESKRSMMNITLVQKMDPSLSESELSRIARANFSKPIFSNTSIEPFLSRNGIYPSSTGYIDVRKGSITYSFQGFSSERGDAVIDSTLYCVMSLASISAALNQPSGSQALIFSGDVNTSSILQKLKVMSIIVPKREGAIPEYGYVWRSPEKMNDVRLVHGSPAHVTVEWRDARTPAAYMKTPLPVLSYKMSCEFAWVLKARLYHALRSSELNATVNVDITDSASDLGDEIVRLDVICTDSQSDKVYSIVKNEMKRLATWGVDETEYVYARESYRNKWLMESRNAFATDPFTGRCRSAFLYGSSLASDSEKIKYAYRDVPDSVQVRIFNKYISKLFIQSPSKDYSIHQSSLTATRDTISRALAAYDPQPVQKLDREGEKGIDSSVIWDFPNGVRFVYKKADTGNLMYYDFVVKGTREHIQEARFGSACGFSQAEWFNYMSSYGIVMKVVPGPMDIQLRGRAPRESVDELFRCLCAIIAREENAWVFGPKSTKLVSIVCDMDEYEMKTIVAGYAERFGESAMWCAPKPVYAAPSYRYDDYSFSSEFAWTLSSANLAVSRVAVEYLRQRLAAKVCGHGFTISVNAGFRNVPLHVFSLDFGIAPVSLEHFANSETRISREEVSGIVGGILKELAATGVSDADLKLCRSLAENEFASYSKTPAYHHEVVIARYLYNRDVTSHFSAQVKNVTSAQIQDFFKHASSTSSNR